jgi:hypothetical protein
MGESTRGFNPLAHVRVFKIFLAVNPHHCQCRFWSHNAYFYVSYWRGMLLAG